MEAQAWMGKVVDKDTGKPVEGVAIVRTWYETIALPPHPYSGVLAIKETLTDKNGRFMIPAEFYIPVPILRQVEERSAALYKPGYKFLNLYKKRFIVEMEKVPTRYETRKREADKAEYNSYSHSDETKLLSGIIDRERDFIEVLKSSEKSGPKTRPAIRRPVHPRNPRKFKKIPRFPSGVAMRKSDGTRKKESKDGGEEVKKPYYLSSTSIEFTEDLAAIAVRDIGPLNSLVDMKDPDAVMVLIHALSDKKPTLRYLAVSALRKIKDPVSLPHLIKAAGDSHPSVRLEAVRAIGEMGDPAAVPALIAALRDKNFEVSYEAATALGKFDDPRKIYAVEHLIEYLGAKNPIIRNKAEYALLQIGVPAVDLLIKALKNKDVNIRRSAALTLGKISDPRAVDPLIDLLNLNDKGSSWAAAMALSGFREKRAADALVNAMDFSNGGYLKQRLGDFLCRIGPVATEPMTAKLYDKDVNIRIAALNYFICIKDKRRKAYLIDALKDENLWIRRYAAGKIAALKDPEFTDALISAWNDADSKVRTMAAGALVLIGPAATGKLLVTLGDKNPYFRWRAAVCLGKIRDPEAVDSLLLLLNDEVPAVKWSAVYALGEIGNHRAIEPLIAMLGDGDAGIRGKAAQVLVQITERQMFGQDKLEWLKWWKQNKVSFMERKQP